MSGLLSVIFSDTYMTIIQQQGQTTVQPKFYKRFVDDLIKKRQKDQLDTLFERLNNHIHISYTIEGNRKKSLDTTIINNNGIITTEANHKEIKLPVHWSSTIPK